MAERKRGHHSGSRRTAEVGNGFEPRDLRDVEIERLQQRIQELELQQETQDEGNPFSYVRGRRDRCGVDRREDPLRSLGLRVEIPEFVGKSHPDDFIDWLSTVEHIFDLRDVPEKLKVKVVAMKLRQHASLWWDHVKKQRYLAGKSKVESWEKMKKLMKEKFLPVNYRQEAFLDYHTFSQGTLTVEELINEFERLRMRCDANEEEEQVVARFLGVLRPEIADVVSLQPYLTYTDLCRLALKVEKQQKNKGNSSTSRWTPTSKTTPTLASKVVVPKSNPYFNTPTTECGKNQSASVRVGCGRGE
ncbi:reverse transcriptase domain-containing protein [Artemisia annua]|uniref:Reverse transcriptase domain-containing protein n=1 Tax=Artemisia annua TaxID=35608 RepID=A0A2U1KG41_ARTAN|nr:reverse transcriptase domain-containing protein [Artemisia annua]